MEDVTQLQRDRTDRARTALANGELKVSPTPESGFLVVNGDGKEYTCTYTTCDCADFVQRGAKFGFACKHIEAVKILFPQGGHMTTPTLDVQAENTSTSSMTTGWMKLWHPKGVQVTLPVVYGSPDNMLYQVEAFLGAGWLTDAPGLEDGEQVLEAALVSRRESKDTTPIVAFFLAHPKVLKKALHTYLNTPEEVQAFEAATGLKLENIPCWEGDRDPDKDHRLADRYIIPLPRPVKLVYKLSAKWLKWKAEGGEGQEPHKHLLVRYDGLATSAPSPIPQPAVSPNPPTASLVRKYGDGTPVKDDPQVVAVYEAFIKARGQAPLSAEGLKAWYTGNKHLVELPQSTAA